MGAPKQKWTAEEEAALKAGVRKHGAGKWQTILRDPAFEDVWRSRSNVDLKDKWRNINVTLSGFGSREKARLALKRNPQLSKTDDKVKVVNNTLVDENVAEAKSVVPYESVPNDESIQNDEKDAEAEVADSKKTYTRLDNNILEAITTLKEPRGSNRIAIAMYIELGGANGSSYYSKLWKTPLHRDFVPCIGPSDSYTPPGDSRGYLLVNTNGGLNQMRAGICDMVAVARIINATLVIPELDKRSYWRDSSNFADIFDQDHFISALANDVKVIKKLPKKNQAAPRSVKHFRSWSGLEYYQKEIARLWAKHQVIRAAKSDSRLANNHLPPDIQKLRCCACYEALRFSPRIEAMGKLLVERMQNYGQYIALHLRYEKDMLAFSGCTYGLLPEEANELTVIRQTTTYWKVKDINATDQRTKGFCALTPKEVGMFLSSLGYPSDTPIYIAAGGIYGGESRIADLQSRYPILMSKAIVHLFDKVEQGSMKEGKNLSNQIIDIHRRRQGSPRKRKGAISGTKGMDKFRSDEALYENPLPECLCRGASLAVNASVIK